MNKQTLQMFFITVAAGLTVGLILQHKTRATHAN